MTESSTPDASKGESGALVSGESADTGESKPPSRPAAWTAFLGKPLFWVVLLGAAWILPLVKSLGGTYPDPPAGFDRSPETFPLVDIDGRKVQPKDLAGFLLVIQSISMADEQRLESDFIAFRERKDHLRSMGQLVVHVLLVREGEPSALSAFVNDKKARKPNNLFLLDQDGSVFEGLVAPGGLPEARTILLDRHARLRGAFAASVEEDQRFSRAMTLLGNWEGCDPPVGEPVYH